LEFSANGGSTWYTTSGDYVNYASTGVETAAASLGYISANTSSAATGSFTIRGWNLAQIKTALRDTGTTGGLFTNAVALDSLRLNTAGGFNLTAGKMYVWGR
jgi:hypothetical protein